MARDRLLLARAGATVKIAKPYDTTLCVLSGRRHRRWDPTSKGETPQVSNKSLRCTCYSSTRGFRILSLVFFSLFLSVALEYILHPLGSNYDFQTTRPAKSIFYESMSALGDCLWISHL